MPSRVTIVIDGQEHEVPHGTLLVAALLNAGVTRFRTSVRGEPRSPICGMGVCFECRVTVGGVRYQRACLLLCTSGMIVETGG